MLQKICAELFPIFSAYRAEKTIKKIIIKFEEKPEIEYFDPLLPIDTVKKHHEKELDRKKVIEDKAKANVVGVTIAITLINPLVTFINAQLNPQLGKNVLNSIWGGLFIVTVLFGLASLLMGGWAAFRALRIRGLHDIYLNDEIEINSAPDRQKLRNAKYRKCWELNQRYSNIASNFVDVSYTSIRNGVLAIFVAMIEILLMVYCSTITSWCIAAKNFVITQYYAAQTLISYLN
jgi:hypothetical protein